MVINCYKSSLSVTSIFSILALASNRLCPSHASDWGHCLKLIGSPNASLKEF